MQLINELLRVVPKKVFEGLNTIRQSGKTNMLDKETVLFLLKKYNYNEAYLWVKTNSELYYNGIFDGFTME